MIPGLQVGRVVHYVAHWGTNKHLSGMINEIIDPHSGLVEISVNIPMTEQAHSNQPIERVTGMYNEYNKTPGTWHYLEKV